MTLQQPIGANGDSDAPKPTRAYRGLVREAKKERTQAAILQAALDLFAERGFEAASVRDISARAGVTHAVIRLHFGTKENLWRSALAYLFKRFYAEMSVDDAGGLERTVRQEIEAFIRRYVRYCARHPEHVRITVQASLQASEGFDWSVDTFVAPGHRAITPLFKRAMADGLLPDVPVMSMIYIISAASQMIFALAGEAKRIYDADVLSPEVVDRHADAICQLLFAAAAEKNKAPQQ
ncbi:MAG: TetR family transcriptional regulator [Blastomonas sp. CACIA14H2]|uniref:TetR/AcrR family transcriptional regulator n=1 Tax=Blastomonas sp. CACIA14H2 TaxID=1419876 RepID=UPI0003D0178E|nr:MAG: TetR family transcriptional regulator [Blastomonas sp. CACIA14H2]